MLEFNPVGAISQIGAGSVGIVEFGIDSIISNQKPQGVMVSSNRVLLCSCMPSLETSSEFSKIDQLEHVA